MVGRRRAVQLSLQPLLGGLGTIALDLMVAVFVSSLLRAHLKPGHWRGIHWLGYASWPIALAHTFGMGTDSRERWVIALALLRALVGLRCVAIAAVEAKGDALAEPRTCPLTRRVDTIEREQADMTRNAIRSPRERSPPTARPSERPERTPRRARPTQRGARPRAARGERASWPASKLRV